MYYLSREQRYHEVDRQMKLCGVVTARVIKVLGTEKECEDYIYSIMWVDCLIYQIQ